MSPRPSRRRIESRRSRSDAVDLLTADHERILERFERFVQEGPKRDAARLVEAASREYEVHAQLEHELFYPAIRGAIPEAGWLAEREVEHRTLAKLLEELREAPPGGPLSIATGAVLLGLLRHHFAKEERRIFARLRRAEVDLAGLAMLLRSRRAEILGQRVAARARRTPPPGAGYSGFAAL